MKLPPNAKKVFQGKIFSVYQWEQELYDGSTGTFEHLKRPGTIQVIPTNSDGKIFISHEEQPTKPRSYSLLGGRQEPDEDPALTAKRELLEEAGLESDDWELYKIFESEGKIDWTIYLFIARNCRKVAQPRLDAGEKIDVKEVTFEEFLKTASDEAFWGKYFTNEILRLRLNPTKLKAFKQKLFSPSP